MDDSAAMRSTRNYAHLLAEHLDARLVDLSVSGATTDNIVRTEQISPTGTRFGPQIDKLPAEADVVTVTAGGNDLQYIGFMLAAAWRQHAPASPIAKLVAGMVSDPVPDPTIADIERTADGLVVVVDEVRERAPRARIVLVDYLTAVGDRTVAGHDVPFPAADLAKARRIQAAVRDAHLVAADRSGAELFSASSFSEAHALGDAAPWVFGFFTDLNRIGASFHPNAEGMAAVAEGLRELLG